MALQLRRGLEADRSSITPDEGELIYTTDEKIVYIGDGSTAGGTKVTGTFPGRITTSATTASLANNSSEDLSITGFKTYCLLTIQTSHAAWVRLYVTAAARTADSARSEGADPSSDSGVIAEVITTGSQTVVMAPAVIGFNNEATPITAIPITVKNKSGSTAAVTVSVGLLQLEA